VNWKLRQKAISLPLPENSAAEFVDLDCANRGMPEKEVGEDASSGSCKKM
jgi:hypothetical protein